MNKQTYNHKIDVVRRVIQDFFEVDISERNRQAKFVRARQCYYYWLAQNTALTLKGMSHSLPCRMHYTTILWAIRKFGDSQQFSKKNKKEWTDLSYKIDVALGRVIDEETLVLNAS